MKKRLLFIALLAGYVQRTQAQNTLSLHDSWQKAMQKSVAMKQKQTDVDAARTEVQLTERLRLPTVSGQYNNSLNVGRSIDPYTNTFSSQRIVGNTYGVSANYTVFDNKQLANQLAANRLFVKATGQVQKIMENDVKFQVLSAFSEVLLAEEQTKTTTALLQSATETIEYYKKLYAADRIRYAALLGLQADQLRLRADTEQAKAEVRLAKLKLVRLVGEPSQQPIEITDQGLDLVIKPFLYSIEKLVEEAVLHLPEFDYLKTQKLIKTKESAILFAQKMPSIAAFSNIGTTYSSAAMRIENQSIVKINYPQQFTENLNMNIGFSVRFPLFNVVNYQLKQQKNQLEVTNLNYQVELKKLEIRAVIEETYTQLEALISRDKSTKERQVLLENVEKINKKGFEEGRVEFSEYLQSKRDLEQAQLQVNGLKYQYFVLQKQLDFYRTGTWQ